MFFIANHLNKILFVLIKLLKKGKGYTLPGLWILKLFPNILSNSNFNYKKGIVLISGTNGKTTTSKLIADILRSNNISVVNNSTGSNLLRGIVTTLLLDMSFFGKPRSQVAVLEVDEFVLPHLLKYITPKALVLLNLSRDQLDRYGETDTILSKWVDSLRQLNPKTTLVLDSTQDIASPLSKEFKGVTRFFNDFKHSKMTVTEFFNVKNINASLRVVALFKLDLNDCLSVINNFEYAYGRGESISYAAKQFSIYLAKNPASLNNNVLMLQDKKEINTLLFLLNDNIPDGRDVSWIYDTDAEALFKLCKNKNVYIAGTRGFDMAVRLQYAGISLKKENISKDVTSVLNHLTSNEDVTSVGVLPNYSAMLEFRKITLGRNIL